MIVPQDASIYASEQAINNVLMIKAFLLAIEPLRVSLSTARSDLLCKIRDICRPELIQKVVDLIATTINDDVVPMETPVDRWHQRTYAVKASFIHLPSTLGILVNSRPVRSPRHARRRTPNIQGGHG